MDEKNNSRKSSNLGPLGYKRDSNHYINFFPLKIILKKAFKPSPIVHA
jgi:hypothetical protein